MATQEPVGTENRNAARVCAAQARIVAVEHPCAEHVTITAALAGFPASVPGQFLQLLCDGGDEPPDGSQEWIEGRFPVIHGAEFQQPGAYLRRPFSIADRWDADGLAHLQVISRAIGVGTRWLDRLRVGETLNLTGPLGRGFRLPEDLSMPLILIGGGVGIPPLLYLARLCQSRGHRDVTAIFGVQRRDLLPVGLKAEPAADGQPTEVLKLPGAARYPAIVTSDDGSLGLRGRVTDGLRAWSERAGAHSRGALVFACGPERMLSAIAQQTRTLELECQLCVERNMGCGLGTCLSCVLRIKSSHHAGGWRWALACSDGPVFDRDDLIEA